MQTPSHTSSSLIAIAGTLPGTTLGAAFLARGLVLYEVEFDAARANDEALGFVDPAPTADDWDDCCGDEALPRWSAEG